MVYPFLSEGISQNVFWKWSVSVQARVKKCATLMYSIQFYLASIIATTVTLGKVKLHKLYNIKHSIKLYYIIPYRNLVKILSMDLKRVIKLYEDR